MSTTTNNPRERLERWGDLEMDLDSSFSEKLNRSPDHIHLAEIFIHGEINILEYVDDESNLEEEMQIAEIDYIIQPEEYLQTPIELHCSCRTIYDESKFYILCDNCNIWFHGECEDVTSKQAELIDLYACKTCCSK